MKKLVLIFVMGCSFFLSSCETEQEYFDSLAIDGNYHIISQEFTTLVGFSTIFGVCSNGTYSEVMLRVEAEPMCFNDKHYNSIPFRPEYVEEGDINHPIFERIKWQCEDRFRYKKTDYFSCTG
jgi:hypothetical protein